MKTVLFEDSADGEADSARGKGKTGPSGFAGSPQARQAGSQSQGQGGGLAGGWGEGLTGVLSVPAEGPPAPRAETACEEGQSALVEPTARREHRSEKHKRRSLGNAHPGAWGSVS